MAFRTRSGRLSQQAVRFADETFAGRERRRRGGEPNRVLSPEQIQREEAPDVDLEVGEDDEPADETDDPEGGGDLGVDRGERIVRGVDVGERGDLGDRLDPDVPGPLIGPLLLD